MDENKPVLTVVPSGQNPSGEKQGPEGLDDEQKLFFEQMCKYNPSVKLEWLCFHFKLSESTIQRWCQNEYGYAFHQVKKYFFEYTKAAIHQKQFEKMFAGSESMMMHLGRNYCGQDQDLALDTSEVKPIPLAYVPLSQRKKIENE